MANKYCDHGLYSSAVIAGYISGTTLTVTTLTSGVVTIGSTVTGPGVVEGTVIIAAGTGVGGAGTYTVSMSQTLGSAGSPVTMDTRFGMWWVSPYTWGAAQDGDGTAKTAAVASLAKIDCTSITSGTGATVSIAGTSGISITSGQTGSTLATTIAAAINASSNRIVSLGGSEAWGTPQVRDWCRARAVGSDVEIMTRAGSNRFNYDVNSTCAIAFGGTWTGDTAAATTQFGMGGLQRGVGGAWGYLFSIGAALIETSTRGIYGVISHGSGATPANLAGYKAAGDVVKIRGNKTMYEAFYGASAGIVLSNLGASLNAQHGGTNSSPVVFDFDDGTEWTEDGADKAFVLKMFSGYGSFGFSVLANSLYRIKRNSDGKSNFRIELAATALSSASARVAVGFDPGSGSASGGWVNGASSTVENLYIDGSLMTNTASQVFRWGLGYYGMGGNGQLRIDNPTIKLAKCVDMSIWQMCQAIAVAVEMLGGEISMASPSVPHSAGLFEETSGAATAQSTVNFYGTKFTGFVSGSKLHSPSNTYGANAYHFKDCDFGNVNNRGPFFSAVAGSDSFYPSRGLFSHTTDGQRDWFIDTVRGLAEWNSTKGFPTLSAVQLDGATPWSIHAVPASISTNLSKSAPFEVPRIAVINSLADGNRTISVEFAIEQNLSWTKADISLLIEYVDTTGVKRVISTFDYAGAALSASTANWTGLVAGQVFYASDGTYHSRYKITTPSIYLKEGSEVGVYVRLHTPVANITQGVFIDPEPVIQ